MPSISIVRALARKPHTPAADAADPDLLNRPDSDVVTQVIDLIGRDKVLDNPLDIVRLATDASPYRLIPKVVVLPHDTADMVRLFEWARRTGHGLTFRASGTSLNGQAQAEDVLVDVREFWRGCEVLDDGQRLRCRPGEIMARVNARLARFGRRLGPDPASSAAASIGGVLANNASGMTCGVALNSYHTIESMTIVLASGTVIDTAAPDADEVLAQKEPELFHELSAIRDEIRADTTLSARLRHKFSIKNTSGYHLDAFLDADTPAQILKLLMVGSEGTLGFEAETVWRTVPFGRQHTTAFFRFPDLHSAAAAVPHLNDAGAQAVELLDAASIRSACEVDGAPEWMRELDDTAQDAAVLTELRSDDPRELEDFEHRVMGVVGSAIREGEFTRQARLSNGYWRVRSGLLAMVGAARPHGTTLITEDVCVHPEDLAAACADLEELLVKHGFTGAVNGHASAGNMHFYLYLDASRPEQVDTYRAFMEDLVSLIIDRYDGSLKGEHGTGRNIAPYVEREWGKKATALMWRVKKALDPNGILGPGVFLNTDPNVTFTHLKTMPLVADDLDPCIECGFCEPVCPSRHVTTTPRQRITLQREMARQGWEGPLERELVDAYEYAAVQMCAGDSSCAIACPVGIDTGHAMKRIRRDSYSDGAQKVGDAVAKHWGPISKGARALIGTAGVARRVVGDAGMTGITNILRSVVSTDVMPGWLPEMPKAAASLPKTTRESAEAVFFATCINRIFGPSRNAPDQTNATHALVALAERTGHRLWIPDDISGDCCGTIWQSKGLDAGNRRMAEKVTEDMYRWSDGGRLPIIADASSCTLGLVHEIVDHLDDEHKAMHARLTITDAMTWLLETVVPDLPAHAKEKVAVIHPTCSMNTLGIAGDLERLSREVAETVIVPVTATCCATAGDRGFLHPELTEHATLEEMEEVHAAGADLFLSGNRTCELGLEHDSGEPYESVVIALERLTRPSQPAAGKRPR